MQSAPSDERFQRAIAAIDSVNAEDPNGLEVAGTLRPKELVHAELATAWVRRLVAEPSQALLLAARAHHLRRWQLPRSEYPLGRPGYLAWRRELQRRHASEAGEILARAGYGPAEVDRVRDLIRKRDLTRDPEARALEDALCLVFVETQLAEFAGRHPAEKVVAILTRTLRKMSPSGHAAALEMPLEPRVRRLLEQAVEALEER